MLALTRRLGETLIIDGHIRVTILGVHENRILLGIEAPRDIRIDRAETLGPRAGFGRVDYHYEPTADASE